MKHIDRFVILKLLGIGNQGRVYRCKDPKLQRQVAIKVLHSSLMGDGRIREELLNEARAMGKVQHPNIVSVFDIGDHDGQPYLVFEYVSGSTLANIIRKGHLPLHDAVNIIQGILEGMAQAHSRNIVHKDLKPANVIVDDNGVPKITDFGIAKLISGDNMRDQQRVGTPRYMAPEYIKGGQVLKQSDVFSLGLIAYELLTGRPAYAGKSAVDILRRIANEPVAPASGVNPDIDDKLEQVLNKALDKDPYSRYESAGEMLNAWKAYRGSSAKAEGETSGNSTVNFLLRRIQLKSDFPVLSKTVSTLNQLSNAEDKGISELANIIVKDYGLTNKILKVVNSAYYGNFAGSIGTISRAIVVLGTAGVRSIAASLSLLDHFGNKPGMDNIKELLSEALYSGLMAREIGGHISGQLAEEAFLGTMLHRLGHVLVAYYLPEEETEIRRLIDTEQLEESAAVTRVLGTDYERIGKEVAKQWNFPTEIQQCMSKVSDVPDRKVEGRTRQLQLIANLSNEVTRILRKPKSTEATEQLRQILERYAEPLAVTPKLIAKNLHSAKKEFVEFRTDFASRSQKQHFIDGFNNEHKDNVSSAPPHHDHGKHSVATATPRETTVQIAEDGTIQARIGSEMSREELLTEGLQEVTRLMVGQHERSELVTLILETLFRGMHFSRIVACTYNPKNKAIKAVTGLGKDVEKLRDRFHFRFNGHADVFNLALNRGADIYIKDATQKKVVHNLPAWFLETTDPGSFFVLPLSTDKALLGMLYAEYELAFAFDEDPKVLGLVKALRNQLLMGLMK